MPQGSAPTMQPAEDTSTQEGRPDATVDLTEIESDPTAGPQLVPPTETAAQAVAAGAWISGKKIVGVWSNASPRNSWINIEGMGWRRLANVGETGLVLMTMIAAHARASARTANLRIDGDNQVHEIYVW